MTVLLDPATSAEDLPHGAVILSAGHHLLVRINDGHYLQVGRDSWHAPDLMCAFWAENPALAAGEWHATAVSIGNLLITHHRRN